MPPTARCRAGWHSSTWRSAPPPTRECSRAPRGDPFPEAFGHPFDLEAEKAELVHDLRHHVGHHPQVLTASQHVGGTDDRRKEAATLFLPLGAVAAVKEVDGEGVERLPLSRSQELVVRRVLPCNGRGIAALDFDEQNIDHKVEQPAFQLTSWEWPSRFASPLARLCLRAWLTRSWSVKPSWQLTKLMLALGPRPFHAYMSCEPASRVASSARWPASPRQKRRTQSR